MDPLAAVLLALAAWPVLAVVLALGIGRAIHLGDVHHRDEVFLRDLQRESARLAEELDQGAVHELRVIRARSAELVGVVPEAEELVAAADRALTGVTSAVRRLAASR